MKNIFHVELNDQNQNIIIDSAYVFGAIETMVLTEDGEEIESSSSGSLYEAKKDFLSFLQNYTNKNQFSFFLSDLKEGDKYTIFYFDSFGFPVFEKITFSGYKFLNAQKSHYIKIKYKTFRKKKERAILLENQSFLIAKGWVDFDVDSFNIYDYSGLCFIKRPKYDCFSPKYMDDIKRKIENIVFEM